MVVEQPAAPSSLAAAVPQAPARAGWLAAIWQREWLVVLLLAAWATFLFGWRLTTPDVYIYDEVYHAYTGDLMQQNNPAVYEWWMSAPQEPIKGVQYEWTHPPLGKLIIGGSIKLFGNNSLGWRFSNALFGVICTVLTYVFARTLFRDRLLATLAGFVITIEGLMFAESRIGTNDIFQLAFLLAAYTCFSKFFHLPARKGIGWLFLTGIFLGLGLATKWPSIYSIVLLTGVALVRGFWPTRQSARADAALDSDGAAIEADAQPEPPPPQSDGSAYLASRARLAYAVGAEAPATTLAEAEPAQHTKRWGFFGRLGYLISAGVALLLIPAGEYVLSYLQMFLQPHQIAAGYDGVGPFNLGPLHLPAYTLPDSSWRSMFLGEQWQMWHYHTTLTAGHPYYSKPWQWLLDIRPVFYYVDRHDTWVANTYNLGNPLLYWFFPLAIVASVVLIIKRRDVALLLVLGAFVINWAVWFGSPRGMFFYHFLPSVPFCVLMVVYGLTRMYRSGSRWLGRLATIYLAIIVVSFAFFYPQLAAFPQPNWYADIHFWLPSWE
ncbi:MAG: phospholipid carrier-dependent glycosyltransferase [Chloroflexi bacterium]|nr:phospholipid carrier-dependent glycosyltransferase [Chloroflexota bacterium]